jgi:uncharacterized delta-60 repeat protein
MRLMGVNRLAALAVACVALVVFPLLALATPAALDKKFGKRGLAIAQVGEDGSGANAVAVAKDGGIIAAGMSVFAEGEDSDGDFVVAKFTSKGKLDTKFGTKGANIVDFGDNYYFDVPNDLALTPGGQILVAGSGGDEDDINGAAIARLNSDGSLDKTLAGDGTLVMENPVLPDATAVLPLAGGAFFAIGPREKTLAVARVEADGLIDADFGTGGIAVVDLGKEAEVGHALLTKDGKIVVVADPAKLPDNEFGLLRLNADGTLDTTFGEDGIAHAEGPGVTNVAEDSKGNLVAAGGRTVARFDADGQLDDSFADDGVFEFSSASAFVGAGLAIGASDSVVLSGTAKVKKSKAADHRFAVTVLTSAGKLDRKFGNRGFVTDKHGDVAKAVTTQNDGKIIAAGRTFGRNIFIGSIAGRETAVMLARYLKP